MTETEDSTAGRRDRVGMALPLTTDAPWLLDRIVEAEQAGMRQIWMTQTPTSSDALAVYAAAAARTTAIRLGTSIVPIYPQHPLALAQHAATVAALAPGRLRLGVGTAARSAIERHYGLPMDAPLRYLKEYVAVLHAALWDGAVDYTGRFIRAQVRLEHAPRVPVLTAALGAASFRLAGEVADGAIAWNCPASYLRQRALPALQAGATTAGRPAPPLIAHVWVALSTDTSAVRAAAQRSLQVYTRLPFYTNMWAAAGFPLAAGDVPGDALLDALVIAGDEPAVAARLDALLAAGFAEILVSGLFVGDEARERTRLFRFLGSV